MKFVIALQDGIYTTNISPTLRDARPGKKRTDSIPPEDFFTRRRYSLCHQWHRSSNRTPWFKAFLESLIGIPICKFSCPRCKALQTQTNGSSNWQLGLSVVWNCAEFITFLINKRGIPPGAHVGLNLIIWLGLLNSALVHFLFGRRHLTVLVAGVLQIICWCVLPSIGTFAPSFVPPKATIANVQFSPSAFFTSFYSSGPVSIQIVAVNLAAPRS